MKHFSTVCASTSFVKQFTHLNVVIVLLVVSVWTGHYSGVTLRASACPFHTFHHEDLPRKRTQKISKDTTRNQSLFNKFEVVP